MGFRGLGVTRSEPKDNLHKIAYELLTTESAYVARLHLLDQVLNGAGGKWGPRAGWR